MSTRELRAPPPRTWIAAALLGGALWGCGAGADSQAEQGGGDSLPPAAGVVDTLPPAEIGSGDFTVQAGQPWSDVARFLDGARVGFATTFPAYETQHVPVCDGCPDAHLSLYPEARIRNLRSDQVAGRRRIVARVAVDRRAPGGRGGDFLRWLGLGPDNPSREAYLVLTGDSAAVFIYSTGDTINLAPRRWRFRAGADTRPLRYSMARWGPVLHAGEAVVGLDPHLSGLWLACADGWCTAQPQ